MGRDLDQYVHPERISSQLICPICTQVLQNPVQTETEHLFCEEELLEWMTRSNLCPITKSLLNPSSIRKPSRIIVNMLAELELYCSYRPKGCTWMGKAEQLENHLEKDCVYHQNFLLQDAIEIQNIKLQETIELVSQLEMKNEELLQENGLLKQIADEYQRRLRLFTALLSEKNEQAQNHNSDVDISFVSEEEDRVEHKSNHSSAHSSPNRKKKDSNSSQKLSDAERLKRLSGLKITNSTGVSSSESHVKESYDIKDNRK
jgi:hypothetical protein